MSQRVEIKNFLKNLSVGEYKRAHDNLRTVVEDKLKAKIVKANKKRIF
jgi:hypothetical protein|tara:strand:+ start:252 stop:395 length:144 start_codon:yes stop_codon:yes gene_type:complete